MDTTDRPGWWSSEDDSAWDRIKMAFRRDWEQTKHDFGSSEARDLNQNVNDTVRQMAGSDTSQPDVAASDDRTFDEVEPAYRYGYNARRHYGDQVWNDDLDTRLRDDWTSMGRSDYDRYRTDIRRGWDYQYDEDRIGRTSTDTTSSL